MNDTAEFLIDGLRAIVKWHGGDATGCNPQLLLDRITALLAAAEAREAFPIPDTLPEVPEVHEAGEPTAAEVIAAAKAALTEANDAICGITGLGNMAKQVAIAFSAINRGFKAIAAWEASDAK